MRQKARFWGLAGRAMLGGLVLVSLTLGANGQEDDLLELVRQVQGQVASGGGSPQELVAGILPGLSRELGLSARQPVVAKTVGKAEVRAMLLEALRRQYPGETLERMSLTYKRIGLIEPEVNLRAEALKLYEGQVAAYYDHYQGQLAVLQDQGGMQLMPTLRHELTHALQDQHFPLKAWLDPYVQEDDQALARLAVIEGQAVVAMFGGGAGAGLDEEGSEGAGNLKELLAKGVIEGLEGLNLEGLAAPGSGLDLGQIMQEQLQVTSGAGVGGPAYLRAQLGFPYVEGTRFIQHLAGKGSMAQVVQQTFARPPASTEQILHPEKWLAREAPLIPGLGGLRRMPGWKVLWETTVGELNFRTLFGGAAGGGSGWGGDRVLLLEGPGRRTVAAIMTYWDTQEAASRAVGQWRARMLALFGGQPVNLPKLSELCLEHEGKLYRLRRQGKAVGYLGGAPAGQEGELWQGLWAGLEGQ